MLLSSTERLLMSLTPGELGWVRLGGLFTPKVVAGRIMPVEDHGGARPWDGIVALLRSQTTQWQHDKLSVRLVLSNHFVRYALVPQSKDVSGKEEELALARFHFARVHGEASRGWDIRLCPVFGKTGLASAVDTDLINALRQSFPHDWLPRLGSVQPLLMSVFNSGSGHIPDAGAWLLMVEVDRACVVLIVGRTWHAVHNAKGMFTDPEAWISLVERVRWSVNLNVVPRTILVHSAQGPPVQNRTVGSWKVKGLPTRWPARFLPDRDSAYAMALTAV